MSKTTLQVRDIDREVLDVLKARAEAQGLSLSGYVRRMLAQEAALPSVEEVMARIARRKPVAVSSADVRALVEEGQRW